MKKTVGFLIIIITSTSLIFVPIFVKLGLQKSDTRSKNDLDTNSAQTYTTTSIRTSITTEFVENYNNTSIETTTITSANTIQNTTTTHSTASIETTTKDVSKFLE